MDKYELVYSALKSYNNSEIFPLSLWCHFPGKDRIPNSLAREEIAFQKRYDPDLMKISPHGRYCCTDFGCVISEEVDAVSGSTHCIKCAISSLEDWESLEPVDVHDGDFGKQIKAAELIMKEYASKVPSMMTVFSPFMVASKIDPELLQRINDPDALDIIKGGLEIINKVMVEFSKATLDTGVDGLFIASQHFNKLLTEKDVKSFEVYYIQRIVKEMKNRPDFFTVLHLHGQEPRFQLAVELLEGLLPAGINWHDRMTPPTLDEAKFKGGLLGGLDERNSLRKNSPDQIKESLESFLTKIQDKTNKIISPGCVIPTDTQVEAYDALIKAVKI
ncbi:MAG: uroporphyrinogen decarboxylase family protein [Candidatus Hodarchaeales archaeon]|jgi:uroporphyrinogen decarboxylase